jgi:hypothetical protein
MSTTQGFPGFLDDRELALVAGLKTSTPRAAFTELSNDFFQAYVEVFVSIAVVAMPRLPIDLGEPTSAFSL